VEVGTVAVVAVIIMGGSSSKVTTTITTSTIPRMNSGQMIPMEDIMHPLLLRGGEEDHSILIITTSRPTCLHVHPHPWNRHIHTVVGTIVVREEVPLHPPPVVVVVAEEEEGGEWKKKTNPTIRVRARCPPPECHAVVMTTMTMTTKTKAPRGEVNTPLVALPNEPMPATVPMEHSLAIPKRIVVAVVPTNPPQHIPPRRFNVDMSREPGRTSVPCGGTILASA